VTNSVPCAAWTDCVRKLHQFVWHHLSIRFWATMVHTRLTFDTATELVLYTSSRLSMRHAQVFTVEGSPSYNSNRYAL
jgi:hypothetical protein